MVIYLFVDPISSLYISDSDPLRELTMMCARSIATVTLPLYFVCTAQNATAGALRGMGYSTIPMITSILGICVYRVLWILFVFPLEPFHNARGIYLAFPISWALVTLANLITIGIVFGKVKRKLDSERELLETRQEEVACQEKMHKM
jgi:Na+-driven multidrug efflux pump